MRGLIATCFAFVAPACVLATDFSTFTEGSGRGQEADSGVAIDGATSAPESGGPDASVSTYAAAVLADVPLLYYRLDDALGSVTAHDSSGHGHDALLNGTVTFGAAGALGNEGDTAVSFTGNGALYVPGVAAFAGTQPFSIETWVHPSIVPDGDGIAVAATEHGSNDGWALFFSKNRHPQFERETANTDDIATAVALAPAQGYIHVVGTFDGSALAIYVNGALSKKVDSSAPIPGDAGVPFAIGAVEQANTYYFAGEIDEVAVYDHALDPARVAAHWVAAH